ncbi:MAG: peptidyl-prolyl cis-trans isomerase [Thermoanaerobaculia bacterium]|nr:peptidyl-prolyl cis-trans isomerase [Thermoanaerobaculia bacterium]
MRKQGSGGLEQIVGPSWSGQPTTAVSQSPARPLLASLLLGVLIACGGPQHSSGPDDQVDPATLPPDLLAIYDGGQVTLEDLDSAILELPQSQRAIPIEDSEGWYRQHIEQIALDDIERARIEGTLEEDPSLKPLLRDLERTLLLEEWAKRQSLEVDEVTEAEARSYYEEHREIYRTSENRSVAHLFLRSEGRTQAELLEQLTELRARILRGESFERLVAEFSESETRHRHGTLGTMSRGDLPTEIEEIVFALETNVPSDPVLTPQGGHLFIVGGRIDAKAFEFDEVRSAITRQLMAVRRADALAQLTESLPAPADLVRVDDEELDKLMKAGDPTVPVFTLGELVVTVGTVESMLKASAAIVPPPSAAQLLKTLEQRERIAAAARASGIDRLPTVQSRLAAEGRRLARDLVYQRSREAIVDRHPERLRAYFEEHELAFRTPLSLELRKLVVPFDRLGVAAVMARLEALVDAKSELEAIQREVGGEIEAIGWLQLSDRSTLETQRLAAFLAPLAAGQLSPPRRVGETLQLFEVLDRREPESRPFEGVSAQVRQVYLRQNAMELQKEWVESRLEERNFRILPDGLNRAMQRAGVEGPQATFFVEGTSPSPP